MSSRSLEFQACPLNLVIYFVVYLFIYGPRSICSMGCIRDWHSKSMSNVMLNEKDQLPSRVHGSYGNWSKCGEEVIFLMDSVFFKLHDCWQLLALGHVLRDVPESVFLTRGLAERHTHHSWRDLTRDTSLDRGRQSGTDRRYRVIGSARRDRRLRASVGGSTQRRNIWTPPSCR